MERHFDGLHRESGESAIDPDEPWRYRCPSCGSSSVQANRGYGRADQPDTDPYRCKGCGWTGETVRDAMWCERRDPLTMVGSDEPMTKETRPV